MTLSILGKQYICKNFGDVSLCCVKTGLSWYYTVGGTDYPEAGGTAQIVMRFALGFCDSLMMTSPNRGTFTKAQLDAVNAGSVTPEDALEITYHDEPTEVQWCFIPCEDLTPQGQTICEDVYQCFWWNRSCHSVTPSCEELDNPEDCERYFPGYYWYDGGCHPTLVCENIVSPTDCLANGCFYYNGGCHTTLICEDIILQTECEAHGCFYYGGKCHSVDRPELCYWIDSKGGPTGLTIPDIYEVGDAYVLNTPPSGYTFIPTVVNVYGVADYYLGFDGDAKTGCDYY